MWLLLYTSPSCGGNFTCAKGIETKREEVEVGACRGWNTALPTIASFSKHLQTNGFERLTSLNISSKRLNGIISYLFMNAPHFFPPLLSLYLTQWELMELLWWWCMGDCVRRQMGKCNYGCFRALGKGKKKTCHKGEFKKRRQHHSSCETIVRKN